MKRFYLILFAVPVLAFSLLYFSVWWFIAGLGAIMIFIGYRFYSERLGAVETSNELLADELEDLHMRLEKAVLKEQKTSKEAEQVKHVKQQLLSVLSHEIRTPMNGVLGTSLLLADTSLTKEQQEYLSTIRGCGESLLTTINNLLANDILDFSKLQQEGIQLEYKDFDLRDVVEEVIGLFAGKTNESGIDLVYDIDQDVPEQIIGDNKRLRQVLMNLVENAVKFTRKGEIFVGVHYLPESAGYATEINFEVRDTGPGIPKEQLNLLFKGIAVKENQKEKTSEKSGLGLVICRKLVELMGGNIQVKSQENTGSTFTFSIPLTPSLKPVRNHGHFTSMYKLQGKNVLIIEDNATQRAVLLKQMREWKMLPVAASSAEQAISILSGNNVFDLVITDLDLNGMNSVDLVKTIRSQYPAMPVILMSPKGNDLYKMTPELFNSVLLKPIRQYMLREHVINIFNTSAVKKEPVNKLSDEFSKQYPLRILIAEDNPINQKIATKILTKLGYQPSLAQNGKEALEMVSSDQYDMILMDVQMPEMDGLEATRMIRTCLEIQPVIIAMTANVLQGDRDACMQAGMDDYISKPIDLKELLSQFEKWSLVIRGRRE
jgi:signal transduction histidine kinase/DNA-binding response OmpR family regulator